MQPLERDLRTLESEVDRAGPGEAARALDRAGDLCLGEGQRDRALVYYGRAIDASLVARRYNAAAGLCRKLLRVVPSAVRTRCTLAWLALGRGDVAETTREIDGYVDAATEAGQQGLAAAHLRMMAETTRVPDIRAHVADRLDRLGQAGAAQAVRRTAAHDEPVKPLRSDEQVQLWRSVVRCALLGPEDLRG